MYFCRRYVAIDFLYCHWRCLGISLSMASSKAFAGHFPCRFPDGYNDCKPLGLFTYRSFLWHCRSRYRHVRELETLSDSGILWRFHYLFYILQRNFDPSSHPTAMASRRIFRRKCRPWYYSRVCRNVTCPHDIKKLHDLLPFYLFAFLLF